MLDEEFDEIFKDSNYVDGEPKEKIAKEKKKKENKVIVKTCDKLIDKLTFIKPENKYECGKIYKLVDQFNNTVYIGSTTLTLNLRMNAHRCDMKNEISSTCKELKEKIGIENITIELIEEYPCETKLELEQRENFYIKNNEGIFNKVESGRVGLHYKEYYQQNKERIKEYYKKPEQKEKQKKWYEKNREKVKQKYREKNNK